MHFGKNLVGKAQALASGSNYTPANLTSLVHREVRRSQMLTSGYAAPLPRSVLNGVGVPQLEGCLTAVATRRDVLLADVAKYVGRPAVIIVLQPLPAAKVWDVVIVGLSCSDSNTHVITRVTVPKG